MEYHSAPNPEPLCRALYVALKDGAPVRDLAVELACLVYDSLPSASVVRLVGEDLTEEQARDAARELLDDCDFVPGFDLEPELKVLAEAAFEVVRRDVLAQGLHAALKLGYPDWSDRGSALPTYAGISHGDGVMAGEAGNPVWLLVAMADAVQESIAESWIVWPECTTHRTGLHPKEQSGRPIWWCTVAGGHEEAEIGRLPQLHQPTGRKRR
jgi:hypothetical protein